MEKKELIVEMTVEIPKGSSNKYEYDVKRKAMILDRPLFGANFYPGEYGFIANTLDYDGDALDIITLITYPTFPGCLVDVRVLGAIEMIDGGEVDTKIFGVPVSDPRFIGYTTLKEVPQHLLDEITNFFLQYKTLQKKEVVIKGWQDTATAEKEIITCRELFKKYGAEMLTIDKKDLVAKLAQEIKK